MANDIAEVEAFAEGMASAIKDKGTGDLVDLPDAPNLPKGSPLERALAAITDAYSPLFKQLKEGRKDGKYEIRSVGKGTRRGIKADARAMERELQLIRDREGPRDGADSAGGLSDDLDRRLDRMAQNDIRGQLGLSRAIQQAGRSQLITSSTRQLAALQADLAQQRLQAELSVGGGAAGGGGGGSRGPSQEEVDEAETERLLDEQIVSDLMRLNPEATASLVEQFMNFDQAAVNVVGLTVEQAADVTQNARNEAANAAWEHVEMNLLSRQQASSVEERATKYMTGIQNKLELHEADVKLWMSDPAIHGMFLPEGITPADVQTMAPEDQDRIRDLVQGEVERYIDSGNTDKLGRDRDRYNAGLDAIADSAEEDADEAKELFDREVNGRRIVNQLLDVFAEQEQAKMDAGLTPENDPTYPTLATVADELSIDLSADDSRLRLLAVDMIAEGDLEAFVAGAQKRFSMGGSFQDRISVELGRLADFEVKNDTRTTDEVSDDEFLDKFRRNNPDFFTGPEQERVSAVLARNAPGTGYKPPTDVQQGPNPLRRTNVGAGSSITVPDGVANAMAQLGRETRAIPSQTAVRAYTDPSSTPSIPGLGRPAALQQLMDDLQGTTRKPVPRVSGAVPTSMTRPSGDDGGVFE
jgi:hypothetical protein